MSLFNGENVYPLLAQFVPIGKAGLGAGAQLIPPANATEGALWYNFATKQFQALVNGLVVNLAVAGAAGGVFTASANNATALTVHAFSPSFTVPAQIIDAGSSVTGAVNGLLQVALNASSGAALTLNTSDNTNNVQLISLFNSNRPGALTVVKQLSGGGFDLLNTDTGSGGIDELSMGLGNLTYRANANSTFQLIDRSSTGSLTFNLTPGKITQYANTNTVNAGVPSLVASSSLTVQSANIVSQTIYAVPAGKAGLYRINYRAAVTQAATTSSTLGGNNGFQVIYTDRNDSVVKVSNPTTPVVSSANTTGTTISGTLLANCAASTNLQFNMGYSSGGATVMQYDLDVYVEFLG